MVSRIQEPYGHNRAGGPRLVVIGDSILAQSSDELQRALQRQGSNLRVDNRAVGGSAISYNRPDRNWLRDGPMIAAGTKPGDVVVFNLGHNDFYTMGKRPGWDNTFLHKNPHYMNRETFLKNYESLIREFQQSGAKVVIAGPVPYLRPDAGAAPFLERHHQAAVERIPELSRELADLSKRMGVPYIPMLENRDLQNRTSRTNDGLHLSDVGRRIISEQIAAGLNTPALRPTLTSTATTTAPNTPTTQKPFTMRPVSSA